MLTALAFWIRRTMRDWPRWTKRPLNLWLRRYGDPPSERDLL
jgi:hypothetical protein